MHQQDPSTAKRREILERINPYAGEKNIEFVRIRDMEKRLVPAKGEHGVLKEDPHAGKE